MLVELIEVQDGVHHSGARKVADCEVRVLVSEPCGECSWVRATDGNPGQVCRDTVQALALHFHNEEGQVIQRLMHAQITQIGGNPGIRAEGLRLAVETMLQDQNWGLVLFSNLE